VIALARREGVHQDLDGVALHRVPGALGRVALRHDLVEQHGQDPAPAREARAARGHDRIGLAVGVGSDEVERVDLERPDEARVEALEVEDDHVGVQPGDGLEDVPSRLRLLDLVDRPHARRDDPATAELREVEEVEGGDRGRHPVDGQAGEAAPFDRELHEAELLEDLQGQAGVLAVVLDETLPVFLEQAEDLVRPAAAGEHLALAEERTRHRVEAVILHPHEGAAQEEDPIQDHPPGDEGLAQAPGRAGGTQAEGTRGSSDLEGHAEA
jgi:hypothetical protein